MRDDEDEEVNGQRIRVWDNGGITFDRYVVAYMDEPLERDGTTPMVGMNHEPFHPQGYGQHCSGHPGPHLGTRIRFSDLPEDCRKVVEQDTRVAPHS